jgi:hypothetical protein
MGTPLNATKKFQEAENVIGSTGNAFAPKAERRRPKSNSRRAALGYKPVYIPSIYRL